MGILIGMDEAGYGPNYGPLVVAATAWEVHEGIGNGAQAAGHADDCGVVRPEGARDCGLKTNGRTSLSAIRNPKSEIEVVPDLYRLLRNVVSKKASERKIAIADSKVLYAPGAGLKQLERGLHAVFGTLARRAACWSEIIECCGADPNGHHKAACWPNEFDCRLPIDATAEELVRLVERFSRCCDSAGVRPLFIRARMVFPAEFNELVDRFGSKGAALSHVTVGLLRDVIDAMCDPAAERPSLPPTFAVCDKHGGRNFYTALLQHHFSEHWIEPVHESRVESRYEWGPPEGRTRVAFRMNGERFLPTALASMTAKYLRELAMRAFNEFWCARVKELRPTAGYPRDSHRYRKAIAGKQRELKIDDHMIWRNR